MSIPALLILTTTFAHGGCGKDARTSTSDESTTTGASAYEPRRRVAPTKDVARQREAKDRGDGSMTIGDVEWVASSARARLEADVLSISMSRMDRVGDKTVRHSLDLHIQDFHGPGDYTIGFGGVPSLYLVVGLKMSDLQDGKDANKAAAQALNESKTVMLRGAKITVASITDAEVVGTFEYRAGKVPLTDGKFRAINKTNK